MSNKILGKSHFKVNPRQAVIPNKKLRLNRTRYRFLVALLHLSENYFSKVS